VGEGVLASRAGGDHLAGDSPSARTTKDEDERREAGATRAAPAALAGRAAQARLAERHKEVCIVFCVAWIQRAWA